MKKLLNFNRLSVFCTILFSLFTMNMSLAQCTNPVYISTISANQTTATFTWDAVLPSESGLNYQWEIRTANAPGVDVDVNNGYVESGTADNGINSLTVTGLDFSTTYYFYIRYRCDIVTFSPWQATGTGSFTTTALQVPTATAAILVSSTSFTARWNPAAGASHYQLDVSTDIGFGVGTILSSYDDLTVSAIYKKVSGLTLNTSYFYRVRAVGTNASGTSTTISSNIIEVTTTGDDLNNCIWNGTSWINCTPTKFKDATIDGDYNQTTRPNFNCRSLLVNSGKVLTITSNKYVRVYGAIINDAGPTGIIVKSNGSIVQLDESGDNDIDNVGDITVEKSSNPLFRLDYTMWSSPVNSNQTLGQFSPLTSPTRFYSYSTATDEFYSIPSSTVFTEGSGYLIRMPNNWVSNPATPIVPPAVAPPTPTGPAASWTGVHIGIPNANNIEIPLNSDNNGYNMVGNPYPGTLNAVQFISDNTIEFEEDISGTLYFWRRTNSSTPGTESNSYYASFTYAGGISIENAVDSSTPPNGLISHGQGFIVQTSQTSGKPDKTLKFKNTQRLATTSSPAFFKNSNATVANDEIIEDGIERNRLWLNISNAAGGFGQTLVAYMTGASNGLDRADGLYMNDGALALTSYIDNKEYIIQGRALPFENSDVVPLLFKTPTAGDYTITLAQMDGFFAEGQAVYIKDNLTNTVNNLNGGPYNFSSEIGVFPARFEVVYNASSLSTKNPILDANAVVVYKSNQALNINSGAIAMKSVELYDMSGRVIYKKENIDNTKLAISNLNFQDQIIIIKINTEAGIVNKKYSFTR